jgi:uncharacterized membrane protein
MPVAYRPPAWETLAGALLALAAFLVARRAVDAANAAASALGLAVLWPPLLLAGTWALAGAPPWPAPSAWNGNHPFAVAFVLGVALALAVAAPFAARVLSRAWPAAAPAGTASAALLVLGHAIDATSTLVAVRDPFGWGLPAYSEQNPVSLALLSIADGWGFVIAKVVLALVVAVVIADYTKREEDRGLAGLLVLLVFALGFGPGARNLARLALGV